jgi:hypothetical protein
MAANCRLYFKKYYEWGAHFKRKPDQQMCEKMSDIDPDLEHVAGIDDQTPRMYEVPLGERIVRAILTLGIALGLAITLIFVFQSWIPFIYPFIIAIPVAANHLRQSRKEGYAYVQKETEPSGYIIRKRSF